MVRLTEQMSGHSCRVGKLRIAGTRCRHLTVPHSALTGRANEHFARTPPRTAPRYKPRQPGAVMPTKIALLRADYANSHNRFVAARVAVLTASHAAVTQMRELVP